VFAQYRPLLVPDHGCQLLKVADHEQLHSAERFRAVAKAAQNVVHAVQKVGAHHADLVDHQQVEALDDGDLYF
jgi:hypothetical protein